MGYGMERVCHNIAGLYRETCLEMTVIRILSFNHHRHCHLDCFDDYGFGHYTSQQPEMCRATHE